MTKVELLNTVIQLAHIVLGLSLTIVSLVVEPVTSAPYALVTLTGCGTTLMLMSVYAFED